MTIPAERTNSLLKTRNFLRALLDRKKTPRVPIVIRREAYWCLKHFPWVTDLEAAAKKLPNIWGKPDKKRWLKGWDE